MDAADHSNGSATRNEPISHVRLSSFRPEPGQMAGIQPPAGQGDAEDEGGASAIARAATHGARSDLAYPVRRPAQRVSSNARPGPGLLRDFLRSHIVTPPIRGGSTVSRALRGGSGWLLE
jgi:hypothetical protein